MTKRQQYALLLASLILWIYGNATMGIWPIYAVALGASPAATGSFLGLAFLGLASGTLGTGWISARWRRPRALYGLAIMAGVPAALLTVRAGAVWQLAGGTTLGFTAAGVGLALINISVGQHASPDERGRIFGLLALMMALGAVVGNLIAGPVADRWGYPALFLLLGGLWLLQLLPLCWLPQAPATSAHEKATAGSRAAAPRASASFLLLLAAQLLVSVGGFAMTMGRSLLMDAEGFTASTVTVTAAAGSGAALVLNPLVGRLSDRVDRSLWLVMGYALLSLSLGLLAGATTAALFLVSALVTAGGNAGRVVEPALVADMVPKPLLDGRMALFGATGWAGGVLGLAGTGYAVEWMGLRPALLAAALLPLLAAALVGLARYRLACRACSGPGPIPEAI